MTANSNHHPWVVLSLPASHITTAEKETEVFTRISMDKGKVCLASSQDTDAMGAPTNWQAIDLDGKLTADEILLAQATLNRFVLSRIGERSESTPVIAFLHRDNSRIVVCGSRVICETADEVQGITQWRKAPNDQVAFDILTTYVMSLANG